MLLNEKRGRSGALPDPAPLRDFSGVETPG